MQRAGSLIAKLKSAQASLSREDLSTAAWKAAVGARLAARTHVTGLVRERLVVEVEDVLWQRNLTALTPQILQNLKRLIGDAAPRELEFRIGIPKRPPRREEAPAMLQSTDEADRIADPYLSRIYRASRRKAGA